MRGKEEAAEVWETGDRRLAVVAVLQGTELLFEIGLDSVGIRIEEMREVEQRSWRRKGISLRPEHEGCCCDGDLSFCMSKHESQLLVRL